VQKVGDKMGVYFSAGSMSTDASIALGTPWPSFIGFIDKIILPADSTAVVDIYSNVSGSAPAQVDSLFVTTDNSADRLLSIWVHDGTASILIGTRTVPDLSGTNGTDLRVNLIAPLGMVQADGHSVIWLPVGYKLQASLDVALAADKKMYIYGRVNIF